MAVVGVYTTIPYDGDCNSSSQKYFFKDKLELKVNDTCMFYKRVSVHFSKISLFVSSYQLISFIVSEIGYLNSNWLFEFA